MKADQVYSIKYIDAYYVYLKNIKKTDYTSFLPHEAYGYMERNGDNIIIIFIKKRGTSVKKLIKEKGKIVKGLVIPDTSLITTSKNKKNNDVLKNVTINSPVSVTWRDIVYVANMAVHDCSIMYTEGILIRIENDHIVLKTPETICVDPAPVKNHPMEKPNYYIIPTSFIKNISVTK